MKVISFNKKEGVANIRIDSTDDLWHLHKLIDPEDIVSAKSERKIKLGGESEKQKAVKKSFYASISVLKTEFSSDVSNLRCTGKIKNEIEDIPMGSSHTIEIAPGTIIKLQKKKWLNFQIERLRNAEEYSIKPKAVICVLDDDQANLAVFSSTGVKHGGKISLGLVKKRIAEPKQKEKFDELISAIKDLYDSSKSESLIIASPMFWKDELLKVIKQKDPELAKKVRLETVSTGAKKGITELVTSGSANKLLSEGQMKKESEIVEEIMSAVGRQGLVAYGFEDVTNAVNNSAVKILAVTDKLIEELRLKGKYEELEALFDLVEKSGGKVNIISFENEAGQQLHGISGIAALLRFKV